MDEIQPAGPSLHHIGYVVTGPIETVVDQWRESLGATHVSEIFHDPIQRVRVLFLHLPAGAQVELVERASPDSPVTTFAEKGGGMHHLCFEVDDLDAHLAEMKTRKAVLVRRPQPAVAFDQRRIAWMITRERLLVEYLERAKAAG